MACRCGPRAIKVTSSPDRDNIAPRNAPIAPAPTIANFMAMLSDYGRKRISPCLRGNLGVSVVNFLQAIFTTESQSEHGDTETGPHVTIVSITCNASRV